MKMYSYLLLTFFALIRTEDELLYVIEYSRHGARYPKYAAVPWNVLPMSLTPAGARQHYLLGLSLRQRYAVKQKFLSLVYSKEEIAVHASHIGRCVASATAQIFGLYPPGSATNFTFNNSSDGVPPNLFDYSEFIANLNNSAIPYSLKIVPISINNIELFPTRLQCPIIPKVINVNKHDYRVRKRFEKLFDELGKVYGVSKNITLGYASYLRDALICGLVEGKYPKSEEYALDLVARSAEIYTMRKYVLYLNATHEGVRINRLIASRLLRRIGDTLKQIAEFHRRGERSKKKMDIFVGTDTIMQSILMELLNAFDPNQVPFASVMLFELYKREVEEGYYVRILYNRELNYTVPLDTFLDKINAAILPDDAVTSLCAKVYKPLAQEITHKGFELEILAVIAGISILLAIAILIVKGRRRKANIETLQLRQQPQIEI